MSFDVILTHLVVGLSTGALYGIVAMGYNLVYIASGVLNLAQGALYMLGGVFAYLLYGSLGMPIYLALPLSAISIGIVSIIEYRVAIKPLDQGNEGSLGWIVSTFAAFLILEALAAVIFGPGVLPVPEIVSLRAQEMVSITISQSQLLIICVGAILAMVFYAGIRWTRSGKWLGALIQDKEGAIIRDLPVSRLVYGCVFVSGVITAGAGFLSAPMTGASTASGLVMGLSGFVAAAIGGMTSVPGAFLGGLILGVIETFGAQASGGGYSTTIVFAVLLLVLVFRPAGIFGSRSARTV